MSRLGLKRDHSEIHLWAWMTFLIGGALGNSLLGQLLLLLSTGHRWAMRLRRMSQGSNVSGGDAGLLTVSGHDPAFVGLGCMFLAASVVSALASDYPLMGISVSLGFAVLFFNIALGTKSFIEAVPEEKLERVVRWMLIAGVAGALYGLIAYISRELSRAVGIGTDPNGFGGLNAFLAILAVGYSVHVQRFGWWFATLPVYLVALALSASRGSWMGLAASIAVFVVVTAVRSDREKRVGKMVATTVCALIVVSALISVVSPSVWDRVESAFDFGRNVDRIRIWRASIEMFKDRPLTGVGGGAFPLVYERYRVEGENRSSVSFAHNLPLHLLAEFGLLGFIPFMALVGMALARGWRLARKSGSLFGAMYSGLVGMLVHDLVDNVTYGMNVGGLFWFLIGFQVYMERRLRDKLTR